MTKIFVFALLGAALLLGGCGSSSSPTDTAANAVPGAPKGAQPAAGQGTIVPGAPR